MNSVTTKDMPSALAALAKAKGQNVYKDIAIAQQPAATIVENQHTEVPATPEPEPEVKETTATPVQAPEPVDTRNYEQAWKELKQHHDKTTFELREKVKQLENSLVEVNTPTVKAPKTPEELKAFKETYGEAFDFIRSIVIEELNSNGMHEDLRRKIGEVHKAQAELKEQEAFKKLLEEHPDAEQIKRDPKFATWFNEQPDPIKSILASTDYKAISKQLSLYKLEVLGINPKEKKKAEAQTRVDASLGVDVTSRTEIKPQKKVWTGTEINAISGNYNKWLQYKDEIDAARKENRVDWSK